MASRTPITAGNSPSGAGAASASGSGSNTRGVARSDASAASPPAGLIPRVLAFVSRRPLVVLSVCGVLIVLEAILISHFVGQLGQEEFEPKYFNKATYTSRDMDQRSVNMIPTDAIASGVMNPTEDAFWVEPPKGPNVSTAESRSGKSVEAGGVDVDKLKRIPPTKEAEEASAEH